MSETIINRFSFSLELPLVVVFCITDSHCSKVSTNWESDSWNSFLPSVEISFNRCDFHSLYPFDGSKSTICTILSPLNIIQRKFCSLLSCWRWRRSRGSSSRTCINRYWSQITNWKGYTLNSILFLIIQQSGVLACSANNLSNCTTILIGLNLNQQLIPDQYKFISQFVQIIVI